jgi:GMP synthase (glutamine-hydrolysing)
MNFEKIVILDFGGQYTQLIARRVREAKVYSEIYPWNTPLSDWMSGNVKGIILTGGPHTVTDEQARQCDKSIWTMHIPVLGICYGAHLMAHVLGGGVRTADSGEYGEAAASLDVSHPLFAGRNAQSRVWMSHHDEIEKIPEGFRIIGSTPNCRAAAIANDASQCYGLQFHPEVGHTEGGFEILQNFLYNICDIVNDWDMASLAELSIASMREKLKGKKVISALSGGVDSTVSSVLVQRAIGSQLTCLFVDHGLLRKNETKEVVSVYREAMGLKVVLIDARRRFLDAREDVTDPEEKRKIVGNLFIRVFEEEAAKLGGIDFLVQGTIYPDVVESGSGPAQVIKSHHNVGGLPDDVQFEGILEPLRLLFKDEVRKLGRELGIPSEMIERQPFPGPGLSIRIMGEVTENRLRIVRESDAILREEIARAGLAQDIWQYFTVFLPVKTVGVKGDERTYANTIAIRAVNSADAMTAEASEIPYAVLRKISGRIINEIDRVNRVVYDVTSKPPGTIEWE